MWRDSAFSATVAAMEAATEQIREEMHGIMNLEGKGGLRFGAMEALATSDGQGMCPTTTTDTRNQLLISQSIACAISYKNESRGNEYFGAMRSFQAKNAAGGMP